MSGEVEEEGARVQVGRWSQRGTKFDSGLLRLPGGGGLVLFARLAVSKVSAHARSNEPRLVSRSRVSSARHLGHISAKPSSPTLCQHVLRAQCEVGERTLRSQLPLSRPVGFFRSLFFLLCRRAGVDEKASPHRRTPPSAEDGPGRGVALSRGRRVTEPELSDVRRGRACRVLYLTGNTRRGLARIHR